MCFIENNKYYIQHNLYKGMKGLSDDEKHRYYRSIKLEVRQRLKESLQKCVNKSKFYQEAFDVLSTYEADYLILNLFYESDSITIINSLNQRNLLKDLVLKDLSLISAQYYSHVISILNANRLYGDKDELFFLRTNFLKIVPLININDWNSENEHNVSVISKFAKWVFNNLGEDGKTDTVYNAFYLFVKIWNYFEFINKPFNRKAILFYSFCISEYENISNPQTLINIHKYFLNLRTIFSTLFVNIQYVPLLDIKDSEIYKQGYLIKRELFLNKLKQSEKIFSISESKSILYLFRSINVSESAVIFEGAKMALRKRIYNYELPSHDELIKIKEMVLKGKSEEMRNYLFERLYLFEFI